MTMSFASSKSGYGQKLNAVSTSFELALEAMDSGRADSLQCAELLIASLQRQGYRIVSKSAAGAEVVRSQSGEGRR